MAILSQRRLEGQEVVSGYAVGLLVVNIKNLIKKHQMSTRDGNYNWGLLAMQGRERQPGHVPMHKTLKSYQASIFQNNLIKSIQLMEAAL